MNDKTIKFGTDGWRGIIAEAFTSENVRVVSQGVCEYLEHKVKSKGEKPKIVIGYDTRFLSDRFAQVAAGVFAANGAETIVSDSFIPTPILSTAVVVDNADLGIMITASHNPPEYNGYKIKGPYGGSATMDMIEKIEKRVNRGIRDGLFYRCISEKEDSSQYLSYKDFKKGYQAHVEGLIDLDALKGFSYKVLLDPMYGAAQKTYKELMDRLGIKDILEIHSQYNPSFGGINPEPIGIHIRDAIKVLKKEGCKLGICLDGDADRIGAIGEDGNYISSHHIFAIILYHLVEDRKLSGRVIKTVSTSSIIDRIAERHNLELKTTPIGFKYIGKEILDGGVLMGGEESGGLWLHGNIPERDGMVMGLKLVEIMAKKGKTINKILEEIYEKFGYFVYQRLDYGVTEAQKEELKELLGKKVPDLIKAEGVKQVVTIDGYKYFLEDGSWIMVRPSGTEAVVRVYAESSSQNKLSYLHGLGKKVINGLI